MGQQVKDDGESIPRELSDDYRFETLLGRGAFGTVYRAIQRRTGQPVAVKVLKLNTESGHAAVQVQLGRFEREAKLSAQLSHPHIVRLIDRYNTADNEVCIVLEYVPGVTLRDLIHARGPLPPPEAGEIMGQVLDALVYAAERGIVHRDIKPANIMATTLNTRPWTKVLDFGLGAFLPSFRPDDYESITLPHETVGTPAYCAPEQLRGEPVSATTDLYAWGLVFLECLTGRPAVAGSTAAEVYHNQLSPKEIVLPAAVARHPIGGLLRQVLRKRREERIDCSVRLWNAFREIRLDNLVGDLGIPEKAPTYRISSNGVHERHPTINEKRQITLLCCRLQVSTTDTVRDELEMFEQTQREQASLCAEVAEAFGGYLIGSLGEETVVCFGYPRATDTDVRYAARMALEIAEKEQRYGKRLEPKGIEIQWRIGIHTGMATVRQSTLSCTQVLGATRELAEQAPRDTIVVSALAKRLLEPFLLFEPFDSTTDATGFRLVGERTTNALGFVSARTTARALIGRDAELAILKRAWQRVGGGEPSCILISGDPGIGKSRLLRELVENIDPKNAHVDEMACLPEHRNTPLYPVAQLLRRRLAIPITGLSEDDSERILAALETAGCRTARIVSVFFSWLSLPLPTGTTPSPLSPALQKTVLLEAVVKLLVHLLDGPQLLVMEDLHWADPTTLEWLDKLLPAMHGNMLVILTARPEFPAERVKRCSRTMALGGLTRDQAIAVVREVIGRQTVDAVLIERVIDRADGVPLFLEEVAAALLEVPNETEADAVPLTLRELLASRLDRLGAARETLQVAAAIGRVFDHELLVAVSPLDELSVLRDLSVFMDAGMVCRKRSVRAEGYMFRHALIRDAAYDSMLQSTQRQIHARIAEALERGTSATVDPSEMARHLAASEAYGRAAEFATIAAADALRLALHSEAMTHAQMALEWLNLTTGSDPGTELTATGVLTQAMMSKLGWAHPSVKIMAERSKLLLRHVNRNEHAVSTMWTLITYHHVAGHRSQVRDLLQELFHLVEDVSNDRFLGAALTLKGVACWIEGDYLAAERALHDAIAFYKPETHASSCRRFGLDFRVWAAAALANVMWFRNNRRVALEYAKQSVQWSRELNHIPSLGVAMMYQAFLHHYNQDRAAAASVTTALLELAGQYGLPAVEGYAAIIHCWATKNDGQVRETLDMLRAIGCRLGLTYFDSLQAEIYARDGRFGEAIEIVDACLTTCRRDAEHYYEPELHRLRADLLAALDPKGEESLEAYRRAAQTARRNGMLRSEALSLSALTATGYELPDDRERLIWISEFNSDLLEGNPSCFPRDSLSSHPKQRRKA